MTPCCEIEWDELGRNVEGSASEMKGSLSSAGASRFPLSTLGSLVHLSSTATASKNASKEEGSRESWAVTSYSANQYNSAVPDALLLAAVADSLSPSLKLWVKSSPCLFIPADAILLARSVHFPDQSILTFFLSRVQCDVETHWMSSSISDDALKKARDRDNFSNSTFSLSLILWGVFFPWLNYLCVLPAI